MRYRRFLANAETEEVAFAVAIGGGMSSPSLPQFSGPARVDLHAIGVILMIAGAVGLVISISFPVVRGRDRASAQVYEEGRYTQPPA